MSKAEEFRDKAAECDKKAEQARDVEAKRLFRQAADDWRTLAALEELRR